MAGHPRLALLRDGVPVFRYDPSPQLSPVHVMRFGGHTHPAHGRRHIHDFPLLVVDGSHVRLLPTGEVVEPSHANLVAGSCAVLFDPAAFPQELLSAFSAQHQFELTADETTVWQARIRDLEAAVGGSRHAVIAYATLLLVDIERLVPAPLTDSLLERVFSIIDERFGSALSLKDVAAELALTPAYLTTRVRQLSGRTVQQWIIERRMLEARRLLTTTGLSIAEVGRQAGFDDAAYFTRTFRRYSGQSPRAWRGAGSG